VFGRLGVDDLRELAVKLRAIKRKGGLGKRLKAKAAVETKEVVMAVPLVVRGNA